MKVFGVKIGSQSSGGGGQVNLGTGVTGILPIANGGTNANAFPTSGGMVYYDGVRLVNSGQVTFDGVTMYMFPGISKPNIRQGTHETQGPGTPGSYYDMENMYYNGSAFVYRYANVAAMINWSAGGWYFSNAPSGVNGAVATLTTRFQIDPVGNVKIAGAAVRATTEGTNHLDIFDGVAPVGTLAGGVSLYSTAGELRVMDGGGTATLLSPHDKQGNWIFDHVLPSGKRQRIDVQKLLTFLNAHHGLDFIHEEQTNGH